MSYLRDKLPELSPPVVERVFTPDLKGLVAWLETKTPEREYCYVDTGHCLLAQFFTARGAKDICIIPGSYRCDQSPARHPYPAIFDDIAMELPRTFGAALSRARQALTEAK